MENVERWYWSEPILVHEHSTKSKSTCGRCYLTDLLLVSSETSGHDVKYTASPHGKSACLTLFAAAQRVRI